MLWYKELQLTAMLSQLGALVIGYSDKVHPNHLFDLANMSTLCDHNIGNINDAKLIKQIIAKSEPDIVFHLAAQSLVSEGYADPIETLNTNIMGTANLLDALKDYQRPLAIVVVSSDKCYQLKADNAAFIESDPLGGLDPYSCSKAGCELVVTSYRASFFAKSPYIGLASARAGNVIGGGDFSMNRVVPDTVQAIIENRLVELRHPHSVRPWQHVLDALYGYLLLAEALYKNPIAFSCAWNFGPLVADMLTVGELVGRCYQLVGKQYQDQTQASAFEETAILLLDSHQARQRLNWLPQWNIDQALKNILDWHIGLQHGDNALGLTLEQIENYLQSKEADVEYTR